MTHTNPRRFHLLTSLTLCLVGAVLLWWSTGRSAAAGSLAVCWLGSINLWTFLYFGFDKWRARRGGRRIPEAVLQVLALLGGSPGALAAMEIFRHKTIKGPFRILFWCIVALQAGVLGWLVLHGR